MIKKNLKVLLAYISGIMVSLIITTFLNPLFSISPKLFSAVTVLFALPFVYSEIWNYGKYDELKKIASPVKVLCCLIMFVAITVILALSAIFIKSTGSINIPVFVLNLWLYPFTGFFTTETIVPAVIIILLFVVVLSMIAYFAGTKGFSVAEKLSISRKQRIDKKAKEHYSEIEKIKEQYRDKD